MYGTAPARPGSPWYGQIMTSRKAAAVPARRGPGRPRGRETVAGREQLLAAALRVIRADGPDVTMDDIAAAAGVSKPIVYRNIGDKDALVAALSEMFVDHLNEAVERSSVNGTGGRTSFAASMRATFEVIDDDRNLFLFVTAGGPGTESVRQLVDRSSSRMIEQFSALRTATGLDPLPARTWAYATVGAIQVTAMMWLRDGYGDRDDVADHITQLMWPGLTGAGEQ
jgi:AcrR family transcriptional regulator